MKRNSVSALLLVFIFQINMFGQCDTAYLRKKVDCFFSNSITMKKKSEVSMDTKLQLDSLFNKRKYSFGEKKHSHLFVSDANSIDILFILKHEADLLIYTKEAGRGTSYKIYLIEKNVQAVKKYYSFRKSDNITGIKQFLIDNLIYCQ